MSRHFLTHRFLRVMTVISFGAALCFAQTVKIKGTVKDISGKAIAGAWVYLETNFDEVKKCSTVTLADGKFDLEHPNYTDVNPTVNASQNKKLSAHLKDGILFLDIFKRGPVEITMYTLNGQAVHKVKKIMDKGTHRIPSAHKAIGVYLYRIKSGDNEMVLKSYSIGGVSAGLSISGIVATAEKADFRAAPHKDVLLVKAKGFVDYDIGVNNYDTSYNDIVMLDLADTVTDADGNFYQAVKIGTQIWSTSSLRTTKFNDGTPIPQLQVGSKWNFDVSKHKSWSKEERESKAGWSYQYPAGSNTGKEDKNLEVAKKWGYIYNWYAAMHSKIAPKGWHIPTRDEMYVLRTYLVQNGYNYDGTKYPDWNVLTKDAQTSADNMNKNKIGRSMASRTYILDKPHRNITARDNGHAGSLINTNNRSGFNCKPVGSRWNDGSYHSYEASCYLWSQTESLEDNKAEGEGYNHSVHGDHIEFGANDHVPKTGMQLRIVKDK